MAGFSVLGNPIILEFAAGAAVAALWRPKTSAAWWTAPGLAFIAVVWLVLIAPPPEFAELFWTMSGTLSLIRIIVWGIPAVLLLLAALAVEPHLRGTWLRLPVFLGDASYAIYLVHVPLIDTVMRGLRYAEVPMPFGAIVPVMFTISISAGVLVYQHIERPLLSILREQLIPRVAHNKALEAVGRDA